MRIIFLNIWRGELWDKLSSFIKYQAKNTDVLCLMESYPEMHNKISGILPGFNSNYEDGGVYKEDGLNYGQSIFLKKEFSIVSQVIKRIPNISNLDDWPGKIIKYQLKKDLVEFTVICVHGISKPGNKLDSDTRILQSESVINLIKNKDSVIVGGDFNLFPETKSIKMIENAGLTNLIRKFNIKRTRNEISWERFKNESNFVKQFYADYVFVSKNIKVIDFTVPDAGVSDHEPLILDFDL